MTEPSEIDERLEALGRATEVVGPRPGFSRAVMQAIEADSLGLWAQVAGLARRVIPLAAVVAALAIGLAVESDFAADEELASTFGAMEVEW
jgi:hypothetical protein